MTYDKLLQQMPPSCNLDGLVLLVPPADFHLLEGIMIEGCRYFIFVKNGMVDVDVNGRVHTMTRCSTLDVFDTNTTKISGLSADLQAWFLSFTDDFIRESLKMSRPMPLSRFLSGGIAPYFIFSDADFARLETLAVMLQCVISNKQHRYCRDMSEAYFKSICLEIADITYPYFETGPDEKSYISKRDIISVDFFRLASLNYVREHNTDFYAKALCVSAKHLTRVIKEVLGKTPSTLLREMLLRKAMSMLENDSISVSRIAEELCFADQASFCKFFKNMKSITPMEYRRRGNNAKRIPPAAER